MMMMMMVVVVAVVCVCVCARVCMCGLGLSGWAPAFKVFFAPLVDSLYSPTLGRRKTWVVCCQYCIAAVMFALGAICRGGSGADDDDMGGLATITVGFGALSVLASAQDVAVDGWGLQLDSSYVQHRCCHCLSLSLTHTHTHTHTHNQFQSVIKSLVRSIKLECYSIELITPPRPLTS